VGRSGAAGEYKPFVKRLSVECKTIKDFKLRRHPADQAGMHPKVITCSDTASATIFVYDLPS
jgi:hypothetical protein